MTSSWAIAATIAAICIGWQCLDVSRLIVISAGRSQSFEKFASANLDSLVGKTGVAWDVGMIGFFSNATIMDPNGLVNGRHLAGVRKEERLREIGSLKSVDFVFVNDAQRSEIESYVHTAGWIDRGRYNFPNFNGNLDTHRLLINPLTVGNYPRLSDASNR
jgi:hypothetical protein